MNPLAKFFCLLLMLAFLPFVSLSGQKSRLLQIDTQHTDSLKLLQIGEKVASFPLSYNYKGGGDFYYVPGQCLYVTSHRSFYQYDASGKFLRNIKCGGAVHGMTANREKEELYIPIGKGEEYFVMKYDYSGKLLREYPVGDLVSSCAYFKNKLWMVQIRFNNDTTYYHLSHLNLQTGKVKHCGMFHQSFLEKGYAVGVRAAFSESRGNLYFSVGTDSVMYQVSEGDRFKPYRSWSIRPSIRFMHEQGIFDKHIIAGDYLFVRYERNAPKDRRGYTLTHYLYVQSLKQPSKAYNVMMDYDTPGEWLSGVEDDLYWHTRYIELIPLNLPDHLMFRTIREDPWTGKAVIWIHIIRIKSVVKP